MYFEELIISTPPRIIIMLLSIIRITEILEQDHDKHMKDYTR